MAWQLLEARMKLLADCANSPKKKVRQGVCSEGKGKLKNCVLVCFAKCLCKRTQHARNGNEIEMKQKGPINSK